MDPFAYALQLPPDQPWVPVQSWDSNALSTTINDTLIAGSVIAQNATASSLTSYTGAITLLEADLLGASNIAAPEATVWQVQCSNLVGYSNVASDGFLNMLATPLIEPCPVPHSWLSDFLVEGEGGAIHYSWIHYPVTIQKTLNDLFQLAGEGYQLYNALKSVWDLLNPPALTDPLGGATQPLTDALQEALDGLGDPTQSNQKLAVGWSNITSRPITNLGNGLVCVSSNLGYAGALVAMSPGSFITDHWGRPQLLSSSPTTSTVIDPQQNAYFQTVTASNIGGVTQIVNSNGYLTWDQYGTHLKNVNTASNDPNWWTSSYLQFSDTTLNWLTQDAYNKNGYAAPQISQLQLDSSGNLQVAGRVTVPSLYADTWYSRQTSGLSTVSLLSNVSQLKYGNQAVPGASNVDTRTSGYLNLTDTSLTFQTKASQRSWGVSNGVPPTVTQLFCDNTGSLFVGSNVYMNSPLLLRSLLGAGLDGNPQEGQLQVSATGFRYVNRETLPTGCNVDTVLLSVNSNGLFPLSTSNVKILGNYETVLQPSPTNPLSNVASSNFGRLEASWVNGLVYGSGLSNANLYPNQNFFTCSPGGVISTLQTATGVMIPHTDSNANIIAGGLTLSNDGSISLNNQPFLTSAGTLKRVSANALNNSGFQVSPSGYLQMGTLQIYPSGEIYQNGKLIIDGQGRFYGSVMNGEERASTYRAAAASRPSGATVFSK